jgi:hypothetical protein
MRRFKDGLQMPRDTDPLPLSLPPRGLSRTAAAAYVGVGPTLFDQMVRDRLMPRPIRIYRRVVWDRLALDVAFAALPHEDDAAEPVADDPWAKVA